MQNVLHIFVVFFAGIGVVEPKIAHSVVFFGDAKVHANGLGVTYMQIAIGFWREACLNATAILTLGKVVFNELLHKTQTLLLFRAMILFYCHNI